MKFGLQVKFDHEDQHQSIPISTGLLTSGPNLANLALDWVLIYRPNKVKMGVNLNF